MGFIVDFYKGLDTINLIIFWGVIIVVLLLLIFAIIIANKNRKLEKIIIANGIDLDDYDDELAIKRQIPEEKEHVKEVRIVTEEKPPVIETIKEEPKVMAEVAPIKSEPVKSEPIITEPVKTEPVKSEPIKEEKFVAEEHVMEYHKEPVVNEYKVPYQHNVLRENASQTSPIGISVRHSDNEKEIAKARELHEILKEDTLPPEEKPLPPKDPVSESRLLNQRTYASTYREPVRRGNYLDELSKKLANQDTNNDISRTAYEIQQEEDAIISYQELMQKKDSIQTVDEEDAVISIDELIAKKKEQERIYNITKDEENDDFIKELRDFRSDL